MLFSSLQMRWEITYKWLVKSMAKLPWQPPISLTLLLCTSWGHIRSSGWARVRGSGKTGVTQIVLLDSHEARGYWPSGRMNRPNSSGKLYILHFCPPFYMFPFWFTPNLFFFNNISNVCYFWGPKRTQVKSYL